MPTKTAKQKAQKKKLSTASAINVLRAGSFAKLPWLLHGFSTRPGGVSKPYGSNALNLGFTAHDIKAAVENNRREFISAVTATSKREKSPPLITLRQIHSDLIHRITETPEGNAPLAGDGMVTDVPGIMLGILTADCLPVILVDPKHRAVGVFHAGWRGTVKRIVEKGVGDMRRCFGSMPRDIKAAIGPGIHGCCYEVGEEVRRTFEDQFEYGAALFREEKDSDHIRERYPMLFLTSRAPGHSDLPKRIYLDLVEANRRQLLAVGVASRNIESSPLCTACRTDLLFSYREEKGGTGRMLAAVGIKASK